LDGKQEITADFLASISSEGGTKTWPLSGFPNSVTWELYVPFRSAKRRPVTIATLTREAPPPATEIVLPSGRKVPGDLMNKPKDWDMQFDPEAYRGVDEESRRVCPVTEQDLTAAIHFDEDGRTHGQSAVIATNQLLLANYDHGQREGELRLWASDWVPRLYANYRDNQKSGMLCLYQGRSPWLIAEWNEGTVRNCYLYEGNELKPVDAAHKSFSGLATLEAQIDREETKVKQKLREWYRDQVESYRRQLAAELSVAKRQRMTARLQQRSAENAARIYSDFGTALRRSGF